MVEIPSGRFYVLINLESNMEVETSAGGVSWRMGPPCESGECAEAISAAERGSARYYPLHPHLFQAHTFPDEWLHPSFAAARADGSDAALRSILRDEVSGLVFSFEMLTSEFCTLLLEELANYEASGLPVRRPNTMNSYGLVMNQIGLKPLLDDLQQSCLLPLSRLLFPGEGSSFDEHHSFMVKYRRGEDTHLDMHHDDSEVTLNVCLGKDFAGATLSFCGQVGGARHRKHSHKYTHSLGRAVVHKGSHRHGADEITAGERVSLIMWARSSTYRSTPEYLASHVGWRRTHPGASPPRVEDLQAEAAGEVPGTAAGEESDPDPICLSETHDADFGEHAPFRRGVTYRPLERKAHLSSFSSAAASARAEELKSKGTLDFRSAKWAAAAAKYSAAADYVVRSTAAAREVEQADMVVKGAELETLDAKELSGGVGTRVRGVGTRRRYEASARDGCRRGGGRDQGGGRGGNGRPSLPSLVAEDHRGRFPTRKCGARLPRHSLAERGAMPTQPLRTHEGRRVLFEGACPRNRRPTQRGTACQGTLPARRCSHGNRGVSQREGGPTRGG